MPQVKLTVAEREEGPAKRSKVGDGMSWRAAQLNDIQGHSGEDGAKQRGGCGRRGSARIQWFHVANSTAVAVEPP